MAFTHIQYLLNLLALLGVSFFLGRLFLNTTILAGKHQPYFTTFLSLLIGFILVSTGIAAVATGFKTVLLVFSLLIGFLYVWYRQRNIKFRAIFQNFFRKELLVIAGSAFLLFGVAYLAITSQSALGFVFPWRDTIYYATVSNQIFNTGIESFVLSSTITESATAKPVPYHYFELWLNAAVSELFGGLYLLNYLLVIAVAFRVVIFIGLLALWQTFFQRISLPAIVICFFLLYLQGIFLASYRTFPEIYPSFNKIIVLDQFSINTEDIKFLPGYLFFLAFLLSILRKELVLAFLLILAFPVAHIVAAPGIFTAYGITMLTLGYFTYKGVVLKYAFRRVIILLGSVIIALLSFYLIFGAQEAGSDSQNIFRVLRTFDLQQLEAILLHTGYYAVKLLLVTWPYLVVLPVTWFLILKGNLEQEHKKPIALIIFFAIVSICTGMLLGGVLYQNFENHQLIQLLVPILNLTLCLHVILILKKASEIPGKIKAYLVYALMFTLLFLSQDPVAIFYPTGRAAAQNFPYDNYSDAYLNQVRTYFKTHPGLNPVGSCIMGAKDLDYYYGYSPFYYTLGLYLPFMQNNTFVFSLSEYYTPIPPTPDQAKRAKDLTAAGAFYQFVQRQKKEKQFVSIQQSQLDFIRKFKIEYVIVSPNAPENELLSVLIKTTITDQKSGEKFLFLMDHPKAALH